MFANKRPIQILYWLITGILAIFFVYLLVRLFPLYGTVFSFVWKLLSPFILAGLIAYLLYPIIRELQEHKINKTVAILLIYLLFFGGTAYLIYRGYPAFLHQLKDLEAHLPEFIRLYEDIIYNIYDSTSFLPEAVHDQIDHVINQIETTIENLLGKVIGNVTKLIDLIILMTIIPVLVFYFLKDYETIKRYLKKHIPAHYKAETNQLLYAINKSLGNYVRGQFIVSLFVSASTWIVFYLLGIEYSLLLAIIMGVTNIIPYFGPIIGAIPAIIITMTISQKLVIIVLITTFIIQLIESNFLSPYIVGKSINIHPVSIIFALLVGGQLSGILGMILAVPLLAILKEIMTHLLVFRRSH